MIDPARIVVVIPALNEARAIEACLASLMDGDPALASVRFVVADGGSEDATVNIVRRMRAHRPNLWLVHNRQRLQAAGVNLVARIAADCADILVRCDAHALYPKRFVLDVAEQLVGLGVDSVVVAMDSVGQKPLQRAIAWASDTRLGSGGAAHRGGTTSGFVDHGHHAGFRLKKFLAVGGYDETFAANEDAELDARLNAAGGLIWLAADLRITYRPRDTLPKLWRQYRRYGAGRAATLKKHRIKPRIRQALPIVALLGFALGLALSPLWPPAALAPLGYLSILILGAAWIAWKRRAPEGLLAAPALWVMHTAWALGFLAEAAKPPAWAAPSRSNPA